jgi:anti-sigma factor RsiW
MTDAHRHYQQLAVGHVLGGLAADDAADFRSHLASCRDCRARVAELRGIASDLERAERDERARTLVRTEVPRRSDREPERGEPRDNGRIGVRHVTVAVVVVALMAAGMAFWNLHLRTTNAVVTSVADQHAQALDVLASGVTVEVQGEHPVRGLAATDGEHVAVTLAGVEPPGEEARVVAWLTGVDGPVPAAEMRPEQLGDGRLALLLETDGARHLRLTVERGELGERPGGPVLAEVDLRADD